MQRCRCRRIRGDCRSFGAEHFLQGRENPAKLNLRKSSEGHSQICDLARRESKEHFLLFPSGVLPRPPISPNPTCGICTDQPPGHTADEEQWNMDIEAQIRDILRRQVGCAGVSWKAELGRASHQEKGCAVILCRVFWNSLSALIWQRLWEQELNNRK